MDPDRYSRVKALVERARELTQDEWASFLDTECGDDPSLRQEVESLLAAGEDAQSWLETEPGQPGIDTDPERIGPYRVLEKLGEGGMGKVYMAEQEEPVRRRVALKVIKVGMDTGQVVARFEAERQALALMDHPNIARIYDAGATEQGRPYFVMEYVKGEPVTTYCDRHRLRMSERLELFRQVCEGVQHAHQKAIIHRDIKPSNVLVTLVDGKPVPKIIDFGVAKAIEHRLTEKTLFTRMGMLVGTPEYMSPEQAEMTGLDVDTRTDVYSLGVLLYELLVGALPFDPLELRRAGFDEMRRKIREDEPAKPSTRLISLGDVSLESAKRRQMELPSLRRQLQGDLDWITMKALEKDRTRRYGSPVELAGDIEHHLAHEPVLAGPPSTTYRLKKFVRRHRVGVAFATLLVGVLVAGIAVTTLFGLREAALRREATHRSYIANIIAAESSLRLGEIARVKQRLSQCPSRLRGWEWFYLERRADQSEAVLSGHRDEIFSVAFSPDGKRIASGSLDKTVRLWDAVTGELLMEMAVDGDGVWAVAFSPDGTRIASNSDKTVHVWDAATGELRMTIAGHEDRVLPVAFSPDGGRIASGSEDTTIRLWDAASGELQATLVGHEGRVHSLAFSPDGTHIASASYDKTVRVWDAVSFELVLTLTGRKGPDDRALLSLDWFDSVAFSPDGERIAAGSRDKSLWIWDAASGELLTTLPHEHWVHAVAFSPDGTRIVTGSWGKALRIWDGASGELLSTQFGHEDSIISVAFSPDGKRVVSGSRDKTLRLWDAARSNRDGVLTGHGNLVTSVKFSPDGGHIASSSWDKTVRVWDAESGELTMTLTGHKEWVYDVAFSPDGKWLVSGSFDGTVRVWDAASGKPQATLVDHEDSVTSVAVSPDGNRIAAGSQNRTVRVWDAESGELLAILNGHEHGVVSVAFGPDGNRIATGSRDETVRVWDAASGKQLATLAGHENGVISVVISPDGNRIASTSWDKTVRLWDAASGELEATLLHDDAVFSAAFNADGTRLISGSGDGTVRVWEVASFELLLTLTGHEGQVSSVAFSPDGTRIASGSLDETVRLW